MDTHSCAFSGAESPLCSAPLQVTCAAPMEWWWMLPGEDAARMRMYMQALIDQLNYLGIFKEYMEFLAELGIEKGGIAPSVLNVGGGLMMVDIGYEHHPQGQRKVSARRTLIGEQASLHTVLEVIAEMKTSAREDMRRVEERREKLLKKEAKKSKKEARSDQ